MADAHPTIASLRAERLTVSEIALELRLPVSYVTDELILTESVPLSPFVVDELIRRERETKSKEAV